jgi:chitin synthase
MAGTGRSVAIYNGLVYDLSTYLASPPAIMTSAGTQPPSGIDVDFMSGDILDLFQVYGGTDITKRDITKRLNALNMDKTAQYGQNRS